MSDTLFNRKFSFNLFNFTQISLTFIFSLSFGISAVFIEDTFLKLLLLFSITLKFKVDNLLLLKIFIDSLGLLISGLYKVLLLKLDKSFNELVLHFKCKTIFGFTSFVG